MARTGRSPVPFLGLQIIHAYDRVLGSRLHTQGVLTMSVTKRIKKMLKRKTWHSVVPRRHKKTEEPSDFLERIIRLAATRCSMASWGQPFEAIASWMLLSKKK